MTTLSDPAPAYGPSSYGRQGWFSRTEAWLDNRGKGAWIAAMVLGFIFFWPIGLALLAYMIWSKRMFSTSCSRRQSRHRSRHGHGQGFGMGRHGMGSMSTSGNSAFDAYKEDTLRRLEQEQSDFEAFLERLRDAKDKAEFDQFMDDRARRAAEDMRRDDQGPQDDRDTGYGRDSRPA